ncbi:MAG: tetratricopeptide repeat protein [Fusobacteriaceae bacterium]|jgi:tetratricopeptide (TPR) repeat protein|nr:tetratricopeptide repeat protein [Fusobacteriaceae bacterium]
MLKRYMMKRYAGKDIAVEEEKIRIHLLSRPDDRIKLRNLLVILCHKKDYQSAIRLCEKFLEKKPDDGEFLGILGYLYYETERIREAILFLNKALDLKPDEAFVRFLLGNAWSRAGNIQEAIKNYDLVICGGLDIYGAHVNFAKNYEEFGQLEKAKREYNIAYEIDPLDPRSKKIAKKIKELTSVLQGA